MKKIVYISLFTLLGVALQFLIHGLLELKYIQLLRTDFTKYSLSLTWDQWFTIHTITSVILFIAGAVFGYLQGKYWWHRIYVLKPEWFRKRKFKW